jgi:hypothetical protein
VLARLEQQLAPAVGPARIAGLANALEALIGALAGGGAAG